LVTTRSSVLEDRVARVLEWLVFSAEVCNYIDDTGLQVVDVVTALFYLDFPFYADGISDFGTIWAKAPKNQPIDYFCWDLYARFQIELERGPSLLERREEVLHQIERGFHTITRLLKAWPQKLSGNQISKPQ
jgi:arginyl-tRNA synthetase